MAALTSLLTSASTSVPTSVPTRSPTASIGMVGLVLALTAVATPVAAEDGIGIDQLQAARVERLRATAANHLHLKAFDLVDELVLEWLAHPPFPTDTPVVIGDVTVPLGYGSGLEALIENHLAELLLRRPETHVRLSHCPACSALTVHARQRGTVVSKGIDQPQTLIEAGMLSSSQHALFLDFEVEGTALVLRARVTRLEENQLIVYARTLSSSTSSAALLRTGDHLVTAEQARKEYVDSLEQRGPMAIPVRLSVSRFGEPAPGEDGQPAAAVIPVPFVWVQAGAEMAISHARDWTGSLVVGGTFIPLLYSGLMTQMRVNRLVSGSAASLTSPNLYAFAGGSLTFLQGPAALTLGDASTDIGEVIGSLAVGTQPSIVYPGLQLGLDLRIANRLGAAFFVETTPTLNAAPGVGKYLDYGVVQIHAVGGEVSLWF